MPGTVSNTYWFLKVFIVRELSDNSAIVQGCIHVGHGYCGTVGDEPPNQIEEWKEELQR